MQEVEQLGGGSRVEGQAAILLPWEACCFSMLLGSSDVMLRLHLLTSPKLHC